MNNFTISSNMLNALRREALRRNPHDPHDWSMVHCRAPGGGPLLHIPALADLARDSHPFVVVMKSAQVGASQLLVNLALWASDTARGGRGNVLVLMPTQNQMDDFTQGRIDRTIQDSPYLRERLQPEPPRRKGADSKRLKHLGPGYIYLRGADSTRQIASVDADLVILDEYDQMAEGTLELARKRVTSSKAGRIWVASTPRIPEAGIDELYRHSDQRHYHLPCPACNRKQPLTWEENVDQHRELVVCAFCRAPMDVLAPGAWVAEAPGNGDIHGYHFSRLYSPWLRLPEMIEASQASGLNSVEQFYNSDLGQPFSPPNGGLTLDEIDRCRDDYSLDDYAGQDCVAGIDVGLKLHVVIREAWSERRKPEPSRLWFAGEATFDDLDALLDRFNVQGSVIDAQPELHQASRFVNGRRGAALARYNRQEPGHSWDSGTRNLNRTQAIDEMVERFRTGQALLPRNARKLGRVRDGLGDYYRQLLAPKRVAEKDSIGHPRYVWREGSKDDHFAHAEVYCLVAEGCRRGPWGVFV